MADKRRRKRDRELGEIRILTWPGESREGISDELLEWVPPSNIKGDVFENYVLPLRCTTEGRKRIFSPVQLSTDFLMNAASGGRALLAHEKQLKTVNGLRADQLSLIFQYAGHMREFYRREITTVRELQLRIERPKRGALPDGLGLDARGSGKEWLAADLLRAGEAACRDLGIKRPRIKDKIRLGFYEAAKRNPLYIKRSQSNPLVRMALFDGGPVADSIGPEILQDVRAEVAKAIAAHLGSLDELQQFMSDPKADLVHRIAKRRRSPVGLLTNGQVRNALLEIGWDAFQSVGACVDAQMRAVTSCLARPLRGWERHAFELTYFRHSAFGDMPLIVLRDRFAFLREAIQDLLGKPRDPMAIAVVHRLLAYYAELVHARRADDTAYKQRRPKKDPDSKKTPDFKAIVKYIALKTRQVPKKFFEGKWDAKLHEPEKKGTTISLSAGKRKAMVSCTRNEFRLYAREWHKLA